MAVSWKWPHSRGSLTYRKSTFQTLKIGLNLEVGLIREVATRESFATKFNIKETRNIDSKQKRHFHSHIHVQQGQSAQRAQTSTNRGQNAYLNKVSIPSYMYNINGISVSYGFRDIW